jgi:hypothetical protein
MRAIKAIVPIVGIVLVYYGLFFLSAAFTGAGHGSYFFLEALVAPFSASEVIAPAGLILWPLVAILVGMQRFRLCRIAARAVLCLHYAGIAILSFQTDWSYVGKVWRSMPGMVVTFVGVYLASQTFLWVTIARGSSAANVTRQPRIAD